LILTPRDLISASANAPTDAAYLGRKVMEWFGQKTSIAGTQIPNWALVAGAIIIIMLILGVR